MEADTEEEEAECTPHLDPRDQNMDGVVDAEDLEICLFWATTPEEERECKS